MKGQKYIQSVFAFFLVTIALFLYSNHFENHPIKTKFYYAWIKVMELLLTFGYSFFIKGKLKRICYALSIFLLIRVIWQVGEIGSYVGANRDYIIDGLFASNVLTILAIYFIADKPTVKSNGNSKNDLGSIQ